MRYELTDDEWTAIKPIFFKNRLHLAGRPQMSPRPSSKLAK
jgi:hypothetical protein